MEVIISVVGKQVYVVQFELDWRINKFGQASGMSSLWFACDVWHVTLSVLYSCPSPSDPVPHGISDQCFVYAREGPSVCLLFNEIVIKTWHFEVKTSLRANMCCKFNSKALISSKVQNKNSLFSYIADSLLRTVRRCFRTICSRWY